MKIISLLMCGVAVMSLVSTAVWAQEKAPPEPPRRAIAQWDKVTITVEQRIGTNLAILHGNPGVDTNHPDASGGRVVVLYGFCHGSAGHGA